MAGQPGFFDLSDRYEALSAAGDPLERLAAVVDFEILTSPLFAAPTGSSRSGERQVSAGVDFPCTASDGALWSAADLA